MKIAISTALIVLLINVSGCTALGSQPTSNLKLIYEKSAQHHLPDRNPIIVIPGILGSKLRYGDTGQVVWGGFGGTSIDPNSEHGARIISLPIRENTSVSELVDNVVPDGVLDTVEINFLGIPLSFRAYANILSTLGVGGYRDESLGLSGVDYGDDHFTCFQFAYDWRRDNVENAQRLKEFIAEKREFVQDNYYERYGIEDAEVKFDIVAHSMGGLIARYFARYGDRNLLDVVTNPEIQWDGAEDVERIILIGTPNAGAVDAFTQLVEGYDAGLFLPEYNPGVLGTFPALSQLLPRPRHRAIILDNTPNDQVVDLYDPLIWQKYGWGLSANDNVTQQFLKDVLPNATDDNHRRKIARALQKAMLIRAKAFHNAIDRPIESPDSMQLFLVLGDAEKTESQFILDSETGKLKSVNYNVGDGTVLRSSALMDERLAGQWDPTLITPIDWSSVLFLFSDHIGLTSDPAFSDNVLYWLLEQPRWKLRRTPG